MTELQKIFAAIAGDPENEPWAARGYSPVYAASEHSRIVIVGQAPGRKAQDTNKPWNDPSGVRLRKWLNVSDEQFYNPDLFALVPMDFYYPGKGQHGDLPPRKGFAERWHPQLLANMPDVRLIVTIGAYAQKYYLNSDAKASLTLTVRSYMDYLPKYFPLVHPSPLNTRWLSKNPWFETELVPVLRTTVADILSGS